MTQRTSPNPAKQATAKAYNAFNLAKFTVGALVSRTINVAVQLLDARGQALTNIAYANAYLSDNADGSTLTATAPTTATAVGTNGVLLSSAGSGGTYLELISNANGLFDLNITNTATHNYYLIVVLPDGNIIPSPIIALP